MIYKLQLFSMTTVQTSEDILLQPERANLQSLPETMGQIVKRLNTANVQFPPCPLFNVAVIKK
jgi:hypothetical protein